MQSLEFGVLARDSAGLRRVILGSISPVLGYFAAPNAGRDWRGASRLPATPRLVAGVAVRAEVPLMRVTLA
mgnify:CR=1 FL=1